MPAQSSATIWTAFMSPVEDEVNVGDVLIPNAAGDGYVVATLAARTAASRTTTAAGIALTAWDSTNPNRAVEIQTVGPCPQSVTGLTSGSATTVRVSDTGRLERGASAPLAGNCDADGFAYLNFTGTGNGGGGGGAPDDATYVTLSTNGTLTNERVLTAGTGITVTDAGAGSSVTVAAPGMAAPFITQALSGDLANERVLTAGTGVTLTDGGAGSTMTVAVPSVAAQYVTLATSADLANERVLTAGTNISIVDGGAGSTVTINNTAAAGAPTNATYVTVSLDATLTNERTLAATAPITLTDGGAGGNLTIATTFTATSTDTLQNKTFNIINNSLVSTAAGQLLKGDGTVYDHLARGATGAILKSGAADVAWFARGTSLQYLRVNSGGTDLEWATLASTSPGGASGAIQYNNAGAFGGLSGSNGNFLGWQSGAAAWTNVAAYYGYQTSPAADGFIRGSNAVNDYVARNNAGSADVTLMMLGTDDNLYIGSNSSDAERATGNRYNTASYHYFSVAGSFYLIMQSSSVQTRQSLEVGVNLAGSAGLTTPLVLKRASVSVPNGTTTLVASQYECPMIVLTGTPSSSAVPQVHAPNTAGAMFVVHNLAGTTVAFGRSGGVMVNIAGNTSRLVSHNGTDYL